jgi:regulator of sigma E protease
VTALSFFLAFAGFALLVILHELGHFSAAKAVGMRVERFSLFFPPTLARKKIGETEYAIATGRTTRSRCGSGSW